MTYAARSNACLLAVALGTICMVAGFGLLFVNLALESHARFLECWQLSRDLWARPYYFCGRSEACAIAAKPLNLSGV